MLFRALLSATSHDPSDLPLAEAQDDRGRFRHFCGFGAHELTSERSTIVCFRRALVSRGLSRVLFESLLEAKGVVVPMGTLVDTTLIPSAGSAVTARQSRPEHRRRKPTHGYKALVATDEGAGLVRGFEIGTTSLYHASDPALGLPSEPGEVFGDSAFGGTRCAVTIRATGSVPRLSRPGLGVGRLHWRGSRCTTRA